jgi:hypothetical protein
MNSSFWAVESKNNGHPRRLFATFILLAAHALLSTVAVSTSLFVLSQDAVEAFSSFLSQIKPVVHNGWKGPKIVL